MNNIFISIQMKSEDSQFPMNGKLFHFPNVEKVSFSDGILFVTYEGTELQFKVANISYFFLH